MMRKLNLMWVFVLILTSLVYAENVYVEVNLHLTSNEIIATDVQLYEGLPQDYVNDYNEYYVGKLYSFKGNKLYEFNFKKSFNVYDLGITLDEDYETISFPYFRNMAKLEVWDGREIKLELDLSSYASCNENNFCNVFENEISCPEDCSKGIILQDDIENQIGSKSISKIDTKKEEDNKSVYYALVFIIVSILVVMFILIFVHRKQKHF